MTILEVNKKSLNLETRLQILEEVKKNHFIILRGLVDTIEVRSKVEKIFDFYRSNNHFGTTNVNPKITRQLSTKWSIGGESAVQSNLSRFMITMYYPMVEFDPFGVNSWFNTLIEVRDFCAGRPVPLLDKNLSEGFYNGTRFQFYPAGGGFMGGHRDETAVSTFNSMSDALFLQPLLLVTEFGIDFSQGGAFYINDLGAKVFIEKGTKSGDIVIYDESIVHGVGDIDPFLPLDLKSNLGRIVALSTIYREN